MTIEGLVGMDKIAIFGTSGFAREVADICDDQGYKTIVFLSNEESCISSGDVVSESEVEELHLSGFHFAMGVGESAIRERLFNTFTHLEFPNLIHSSVILGRGQQCLIDDKIGNIIAAGCIFTNSIIVGNFGIYNLKTTVGHDSTVGNFVSIMPNVSISGNVDIGNNVFIGVSATILQGKEDKKLKVHSNSIIGAHSLVTKPVMENSTVFGVPAKRIK